MLNDTLKFILVGEYTSANSLEKNFEDIISQLATFSDIGLLRNSSSTVTISYTNMPTQATLEIPNVKVRENSDLLPPQQMVLTCQKDDHLALNLVRNVVDSIGFRVINPTFGCFLPQDSQLIDVTTMELGSDLQRIFRKMGIKPLFNFQNSLTFYGQSLKDGSIHLINRHLLEYLLDHPTNKIPKDFSLLVAPDITRFVAMQDRALIPISFYKYYHKPTKIINLSGFDTEKLENDILVALIFFELDRSRQSFRQREFQNAPQIKKLTKESSINSAIRQMLKNLNFNSDYLAAKLDMDINYTVIPENTIIPRLTLSIFLN